MAEEESNTCKHFSIRGLVSEVRERDAKKCWPFRMRNSTFDEHVDLLPPLPVKNFRRWDCRSCPQETTAAETSLANGENMTNQNDATETARHETTKLLVRFSQQSKENNLGGVQEDNSTPDSNDDQCPLLYCSKKCDSSPTSGSIKGGIRDSRGGCNRSEKNAVTAEEEETGNENVMVIVKSSEISLLPEDAPKSLSSKQDSIALVHRIGGSGDSADQIIRSLSFTSAVSDKEQDRGLKEIGKRKESDSRAPEHRMALGLDVAIPKDGCHQSKDLDESGNESLDPSIALIGNLLPNQDDVRKTGVPVKRLLPKKSPKMRTLIDIMKSEELQNGDKNCGSSEDAGVNGRSGSETPEASKQNDEQPNHGCDLIQDTEATISKRNHRKEALTNEAEGTCKINCLKEVPVKASLHTGEGEANPIETAPTLRGLDLNLEFSGQAENERETVTTVVEVGRSSSMPQDMTAQKGNIITEGQHEENPCFISSGETHENTHKTAPFSNKKRPLFEDGTSGTSSQQHFQDSSGVQEQAVFPVHREVNKKQKTLQMSEPESAVNIHRAIELLAKQQEDVHLARTKYDSGETTGNMNNNNGSNKTAGDGAGTSVKTNGDAEFSSKSNKFSSRDKQYHDFDLNQEPPECDSAEVQAPSPSIGPSVTGAQHSVVDDLRRNPPPLNLSTKGLKMLAYCSDNRNQTVPPQNLLSSARDGTCELLNGYPPQVWSDLNSNARCTGVSQRVPAAELRNGYYSNMMRPVDRSNVKPVPALNFLELMHHSARSGELFHSSRDNGNMGYLRAFNGHGSELHGSEVGIHNGGNKREENPCRPLRPLPRVGVLGPLLQKEINCASNNSPPTLGIGARNPRELELTLRKTNFVARQSDELTSSRTSISQYGVSGMIDSSVVSGANPGCSLPNDNIGQIVTGSREEADKPIRSTNNMEECVVNRNPADFAMADEESEYMIGYHEPETRDQKGKKKRKLGDPTHYRTR